MSGVLFGSIDDQNIHLIQEYRDKHCHFSAGEVLLREQNKINYALHLYSDRLILYNNLSNGNHQILRVVLLGGFCSNSKGELPYSVF